MQHINVHKGESGRLRACSQASSLIIFRISNQPPADDEMPLAKGKVNYLLGKLLLVTSEESHCQEEPATTYEISMSSDDEREEEFIQRKMMLFRADLDDTCKAINFYHEALKIQRSY